MKKKYTTRFHWSFVVWSMLSYWLDEDVECFCRRDKMEMILLAVRWLVGRLVSWLVNAVFCRRYKLETILVVVIW